MRELHRFDCLQEIEQTMIALQTENYLIVSERSTIHIFFRYFLYKRQVKVLIFGTWVVCRLFSSVSLFGTSVSFRILDYSDGQGLSVHD